LRFAHHCSPVTTLRWLHPSWPDGSMLCTECPLVNSASSYLWAHLFFLLVFSFVKLSVHCATLCTRKYLACENSDTKNIMKQTIVFANRDRCRVLIGRPGLSRYSDKLIVLTLLTLWLRVPTE